MTRQLARWELAGVDGAVVVSARLGRPSYVITGRFEDRPDGGADDVLAAELIERARLGLPLDAEATAAALLATDEAAKTLALGSGHADPLDITRR